MKYEITDECKQGDAPEGITVLPVGCVSGQGWHCGRGDKWPDGGRAGGRVGCRAGQERRTPRGEQQEGGSTFTEMKRTF